MNNERLSYTDEQIILLSLLKSFGASDIKYEGHHFLFYLLDSILHDDGIMN